MIVAVVPSFRAALSVASVSDLLALVTDSFFNATHEGRAGYVPDGVRSLPLPVRTEVITVSQMWHPRLDVDPAHRWLRGLVLATCREVGRPLSGGMSIDPALMSEDKGRFMSFCAKLIQ